MGERVFAGLVTAEAPPRGIVDRVEDYTREGQDTASLPAEVRAFFEDCEALEIRIRPDWALWALPFAWAWHLVAWAVGQLCLPVRGSTVHVRTLALEARSSPNRSPRAVIREYAGSRKVMQSVVYAVHRRGKRGYMSATFPLPGHALEGVLRLGITEPDAEGRAGAMLTSLPEDAEDAATTGVFLHGPLGRIRTGFDESLELWSNAATNVPREVRVEDRDVVLVGRHEQRFLGARVVRHLYAFVRRA